MRDALQAIELLSEGQSGALILRMAAKVSVCQYKRVVRTMNCVRCSASTSSGCAMRELR